MHVRKFVSVEAFNKAVLTYLLSKIFNDTKRRAVSLRQLSFLLNGRKVAARLMSVGTAFHRRGAAELKAHSPTQKDKYAVQTVQNLSQSAD